jgi:uncharacterized protein (TIGR03382 family)
MRSVYVLGVFLFATAAVQASSFSFTASSSSGCGVGNPCGGSTLFTVIDAHDFSVTLNNVLSSITDAGQLVTDLEFNLTASSVTESGSSGVFINIAGTGVPTVESTGATGWGFGSNNGSANNWLLCVICGHGVTDTSSGPSEGIIDDQASYASANNSIDGNGPHNPFLESGTKFTFTTTATLPTTGDVDPFSNVYISFGTAFGQEVAAGCDSSIITDATPEPAGLMLAGGGLIGLSMLKRRRRRQPER